MPTKTAQDGKKKLNLTYTQNPNTNAIDAFGRKVIKDLLKQGWVAKNSSKNHIIMRAPDGQTTTAIQHDNSAPRVRNNVESPIKAWREKNAVHAVQNEAGEWRCKLCDELMKSRMSLMGHLTTRHSQPRICPVCEKSLPTPSSFAQHLKSHKAILNPEPEPVLEPEPQAEPEPQETQPEAEERSDVVEIHVPTRELAIPQMTHGKSRGRKTPNLEKFSGEELMELIVDAQQELFIRFQNTEARLKLIHEAATM